MSTLADILLNIPGGPLEPDPELVRGREAICHLLKVSPVIVINEVAQYFFDVFWDRKEGIKEDDFPNVAPPFECFWMEYRLPKAITGGHPRQTVPMQLGGQRVGFFWHAEDRPDGSPGWRLTSNAFVEESGCAIGPVYSLRAYTDGTGLLTKREGIGLVLPNAVTPENEVKWANTTMNVLHHPAELALCFLNCSNVRIVDHPPKEGHRRRFHKLYGRPPIIYKTLHITAMRRIISSEGGPRCGLKQALHIMRGHFKRFEEKPLFGKHKGMWWWESQVRGTLQHGYVKKTYEVHPPKKDESQQ